MTEERDERGGFRVTDRRRFTDEGEPRAATSSGAEDRGAEPQAERRAPASDAGEAGAAESVTFVSFVLGLSTQALVHLGEVERPKGEEVTRDLPAAKHFIDILGLLQVKTSGNLAEDEAGLLDAVLYDLRMRYVDLASQSTTDSGKEPS